ncbi:MAG: hydrogenase iron-sulfur subunit [archaeon]|nr:hydrogenase iron-sulfur subunit [archaeon]
MTSNSSEETIAQSKTGEKEWQPKILAFLCNWCSYAGADLAGVSRIQYPPNIRVIRVPCSGRINPLFLLKSIQAGWDGVLVSGCHPGDCHYLTGNYMARRKFAMLTDILDLVGMEKGRISFTWVSAAEGEGFAKIITKVTNKVKKLGPNRLFTEEEEI